MNTTQFLEYLHEHAATQTLAEELAAVFVLRRSLGRIPIAGGTTDSRRIAS